MTCLFEGHTVKVNADMSLTLELKMDFERVNPLTEGQTVTSVHC